MKIDENGDRESDYALWDMDPAWGEFQVCGGTRPCPMVGSATQDALWGASELGPQTRLPSHLLSPSSDRGQL